VKGFLFTTLGGVLGVTAWIFWGEMLLLGWNKLQKWFSVKFLLDMSDKLKSGSKKPRKFTWQNRFIVKVKMSGGLSVIALLGPVLISLPVACLLLIGFGLDRRSAWKMMVISVLCWGVLIFGLVGFFKINISQYFEHIL